jgi:hypothetical protein
MARRNKKLLRVLIVRAAYPIEPDMIQISTNRSLFLPFVKDWLFPTIIRVPTKDRILCPKVWTAARIGLSTIQSLTLVSLDKLVY